MPQDFNESKELIVQGFLKGPFSIQMIFSQTKSILEFADQQFSYLLLLSTQQDFTGLAYCPFNPVFVNKNFDI